MDHTIRACSENEGSDKARAESRAMLKASLRGQAARTGRVNKSEKHMLQMGKMGKRDS